MMAAPDASRTGALLGGALVFVVLLVVVPVAGFVGPLALLVAAAVLWRSNRRVARWCLIAGLIVVAAWLLAWIGLQGHGESGSSHREVVR
jgi:hypothetical protein